MSNDGIDADTQKLAPAMDATVEPILGVLTAAHAIATDVETPAEAVQAPIHVRNSAWRANRVLGKVIPPLLMVFILGGCYYVNAVLRPYIRLKRSSPSCIAYFAAFDSMLVALITLFLIVYFTPLDHSAPPLSPPQAILERSVAYECIDETGALRRCWQDECKGRWLPPRVRHCKDCRRCRIEFDHCCPWFGTCIARDTLKGFILFLLTVAPTIAVGLWEVTPVAIHHRRIVMVQLWESDYIREIWWSKWYSWAGGPVTRWGAALLLCYWHYDPSLDDMNSSWPPVSFTPMLYTVWGTLLAIFCLALAGVAMRNILIGGSTIDSIRAAKGWGGLNELVWLPESTDEQIVGKVMTVPAKLKLYDHGKRENWRRVFGSGLLGWPTPSPGKEAVEAWVISHSAVTALEALRRKSGLSEASSQSDG